MPKKPSEIAFKFHYVSRTYIDGIFATRGRASEREILLGLDSLSYDWISGVTLQGDRVILTLNNTTGVGRRSSFFIIDGCFLVLRLYGSKVRQFHRFVSGIVSGKQVARQRKDAIRNGKFETFYVIKCPECSAKVGLFEFQREDCIYCPYCHSLFYGNLETILRGWHYGECSQCQMFDRLKNYPEFYMSLFHRSYKFHAGICDSCAETLFRRMLGWNLLYSITIGGFFGLAIALVNKISLSLGRDRNYQELSTANRLLQQGRVQTAAAFYTLIYERYPAHPALLMNQGIQTWRTGNTVTARYYFERALQTCPNYFPALHWLQKLESSATARFTQNDIEQDLQIGFVEAVLGTSKTVRVQHWERCPDCWGQTAHCSTCDSNGRIFNRKQFNLKIPPGVVENTRLRLAKEGNIGLGGGEVGDLYFKLKILEDRDFQRQGLDIFSSIEISPGQALAGGDVLVRTIDGSAFLTVPPGTQTGTVLRLPQFGVPQLGHPERRGDHFVTVRVQS